MHHAHRSEKVVFLRPHTAPRPSGLLSRIRPVFATWRPTKPQRVAVIWASVLCVLPFCLVTMHHHMPQSKAATRQAGAPFLTGHVRGASSAGVLSVVCKVGGGHQRLTNQTDWHFSIDLPQAVQPCVLEWRAEDGQRLFAAANRLNDGKNPEQTTTVSATTHMWMSYLRHVPLLHAVAGASMHEWFAQPQVQALLEDEKTLRTLWRDHFTPIVNCLGNQQDSLLGPTGSSELEGALFRTGALDSQGNLSVGATAQLIRTAMSSAVAQDMTCQHVNQKNSTREHVVQH